MRISLNAADRLSLLFLALFGLIAVLFVPSDRLAVLLATYAAIAAALVVVALIRARDRAGKRAFYLHVAFTVVMIFLVFNSVGTLTASLQHRYYDRLLIGIDYTLFGVHPTVWMERLISPALTAVLQFAYVSYYFIPVSLGIVLVWRGKRDEFEHALFGIVLCFFLSYLGYLLVPAVGPRFTLQAAQTRSLEAWPLVSAIQAVLNGLEQNKTDAFPSGHTAIALVSLYYAWKLSEKILFRILAPVVLALIVSTVYLRYHYVIDVIAGILLAAITVSASPYLEARFSGASAYPGNERHDTA